MERFVDEQVSMIRVCRSTVQG